MKIKTSELENHALNWAVAKCKNQDIVLDRGVLYFDGCDIEADYFNDWNLGGPILDEEHTEFDYDEGAQIYRSYDGIHSSEGPTHLIAGLRCYVVSRMGDEIEVPDHIVQTPKRRLS